MQSDTNVDVEIRSFFIYSCLQESVSTHHSNTDSCPGKLRQDASFTRPNRPDLSAVEQEAITVAIYSDTGCCGGRGQFFIRKNNTAGRHQK